MKKAILFLLVYCSTGLMAQDFTASMAISLNNNSSVRDYANSYIVAPNDRLNNFNTVVNFAGQATYPINESFDIGFEYNYSIFSVSSNNGVGVSELAFNTHMPSILALYVYSGKGYKLKVGGGLGIRFVDLTQKLITASDYSSLGFGSVLKAEAHTKLSGNFYLSLLGNIRLDFPGEPSDGDNYIVDFISNENVNVNSIGFGLGIGVSYFFVGE